ncbi:MAG: helix-turn-helix transcriptional regulator [Oscillospiraceae bacterium]|nr:helix-turn-helix transcriptional regulator [Oscillospiraceae bacterium]
MQKNIPTRWSIESSIFDAYKTDGLTTSDTHWHSHFLLNIITSGEGVQEINGKSYPLHRGSAIIISPLDFHRNVVDGEKCVSVLAVKFSDKLFYDSLSDVCALEDFPIVTTLDEEDLEIAGYMFDLLLKEQKRERLLGSDKFAKNLIEQLVILTLRSCGRKEPEEKISKVRRALVFIHYNFRRNIRAAEVASFVGYSPNYFSSEFKKETGMEFQKYLRELRLDFAMNLLKFSKLSVTEVCFESGFNTLPHFSQTFKKKFGKTPEKIKEEKSWK